MADKKEFFNALADFLEEWDAEITHWYDDSVHPTKSSVSVECDGVYEEIDIVDVDTCRRIANQ